MDYKEKFETIHYSGWSKSDKIPPLDDMVWVWNEEDQLYYMEPVDSSKATYIEMRIINGKITRILHS